MPIFLSYQQLYSFSIQKRRIVDLFIEKICKKRTGKHLSHGINVVQSRRSSENYFSRLHHRMLSRSRETLAPSHCLRLSFFLYIRALLVSESKARGLFHDADRRVVVRMSQRHELVAYNCKAPRIVSSLSSLSSRFCHRSL